jgi:hypothetical protein
METQQQESDARRGRLLGRGPRLDLIDPAADVGRDLSFGVDGDGRVDLAFVSGIDCLTQDLAVALTTLLGSDPFNTTFGFDGVRALAEESNALLVRERVRVAVIQTLNRDVRVRRVVDVKLDDERLDRPVATPDRTLVVRVVFETVTGESFAVQLGGSALAGVAHASPEGGAARG